MSGVEGSSLPQPQQLKFPPPHISKILRPTQRLFPTSSLSHPPPPPTRPSPQLHTAPSSSDPHHRFSTPRGKFPRDSAEKEKIPAVAAAVPAAAAEIPVNPATAMLKQANEKGNHEAESGDGTFNQGHKEAVNTHRLPPPSDTGGKRCRRPKGSKHKRCVPQTLGSNDGSPSDALTPASSCRYDSSLGLLTKKFINLLQQAEDGSLDLNKAADILDVQKRRIYDITNVLEGVGLIEKKLKNRIRWKGLDLSRPKELDDQITGLKTHIETLYTEECRLDGMIREMQDNLRALSEDENNQKWLYVTMEDINSLPCFKNDTLIAIKAPHGTSLEVPDPDEGVDFPHRQYEILLRSSTGPIDCYLISKHEERFEATNQDLQLEAVGLSVENSSNGRDNDTSSSPEDPRASVAFEASEEASQKIYSDSLSSHGFVNRIFKIAPSDLDMDADYWLLSDSGVSITDTWRTE